MKSEWVFAIEESKLPDNGMTAVYPKIFGTSFYWGTMTISIKNSG